MENVPHGFQIKKMRGLYESFLEGCDQIIVIYAYFLICKMWAMFTTTDVLKTLQGCFKKFVSLWMDPEIQNSDLISELF